MAKTAAAKAGGKSAAKRRLILDAAAKEFRENAYADVRLADIAAAAGTQAGSLYYHFESREDLVDQVLKEGVDRIFSEVVARVEALPADASPGEKLSCAITAHLESMLELDDYSSAHVRTLRQVPRAIRTTHRKRQRAYMEYWRDLFDEAVDAGLIRPGIDPSVSRMLLHGMLNWTNEWYRAEGRSATEIAEQTAELLLNGIMAPQRGKRRGMAK